MPSFPPAVRALRRAIYAARAILFRRRFDADLRAELHDHLDQIAERHVARGMSPADARLAARREFGNVTSLGEQARDASGASWMDALVADTRFALRYFARHKATTAIIVTVITLGAVANTAILSTVQAQFLRPAPAVPNDDDQSRIFAQERATRAGAWKLRGFTGPELDALAARHEIFRDVAAWTEAELILDGGDSTGARSVNGQFVTPNYFATLGVGLAAGVGLANRDGNTPDMTAIMSHKMADQLYGSAAAAVGRRILVNSAPVFVVGVAPERFQGALRNMDEPAVWIPLSARADVEHVSRRWLMDDAALSLFTRLAPGASRAQATAVARQVVIAALPDSAARVGMSRTADVLDIEAPPPGGDTHEMLLAFTMITIVGVVILLVAWTNVSSLMVAAAVGRRHEIAVRLSLGASRPRLLRQLVTESTILALTGGALGLTLAWWWLAWQSKTEIDGVDITPDLATVAVVLAMAVVTGVVFGLSPALHATRAGVANALRDSGTATSGRSRLQRGFVIAQIALSQPLLVLLGTMLALMVAEYRPLAPEMSRHVVTAAFHPLKNGSAGQRAETVDSLIPRIAERPEVLAAVPEPTGFDIRGVFAPDRTIRDAAQDTVSSIVHLEGTAPGWFAAVDVPILLGRDVSWADTTAADYPVVISSDFARALWGDANPVGRTLTSPALRGLDQDSIALTVVGVYDAAPTLPMMSWSGGQVRGSASAAATRVFTARGKHWRHDRVLVRTRGPAAPFMPELRKLIRLRAPAIPMSMLTFAQENDRRYADMLQSAALAGGAGLLALLLASLGLYGVVSLAIRQRTREIGIRIAVGAAPMRVARMFLASGVRASLFALALGLPLSVVALKIGLAQGVVIAPQVNPYVIGTAIALLLIAVASLASWVPARRAARVDPATTLRVE
jgi:predicted permease